VGAEVKNEWSYTSTTPKYANTCRKGSQKHNFEEKNKIYVKSTNCNIK